MHRPYDNLVLFDGVCNLCTGSVQFIIRRDPRGKFKFAPIQSALGQQLLQQSGLADGVDSFVLVTRGKVLTRSDAAIEVARRLGGPWRLGAALGRLVPRRWRDAVYQFIADRRLAWFGQSTRCMVPSDELRSRFLG